MKPNGTATWTAASVGVVLLVASIGWSWSLSGLVSQVHTTAQDHARRIEALEAARAADREILQRLARLEEAVAHVRSGQERLVETLDRMTQAREQR